MEANLVSLDGKQYDVSQAQVQQLRSTSALFWLDLRSTDDGSAHELLANTFNFHPLALEDVEKFGQRPKIDSYDDYAHLVVYGLGPDDHLVEVHCFCTESYLVTVHQEPCPGLLDVAKRLQVMQHGEANIVMVLYRVIDLLVDGFFPTLARLDDRIDDLEDAILQAPTDEQLGQLFDMKRSLIALRKVVTPQRDLFATLIGDDVIPGMTPDTERYFRDLYDHLIRVSDLVDSYRDLLSGAMDTHLSTVSNRLNEVMKQLTIIATIFLPLSFLTGFFGQNFTWLVNRLGSFWVFLLAGMGLEVVAVVALVVMFRKRGWLSPKGTVPPGQPPRVSRRVKLAPARWLTIHPGSLHDPATPPAAPSQAQPEPAPSTTAPSTTAPGSGA